MCDPKTFLNPDAIKRLSRLDLRRGMSSKAFCPGCTAAPTSANRSNSASTANMPSATTCGTSTGKSGPSKIATTSSNSRKIPICGPRYWSMCRTACAMGRPARQVRIRRHDRREPGLSAACGSRTRRLRGVRRAGAHDRAAAHEAEPFELDHAGLGRHEPQRQDRLAFDLSRGGGDFPRRGLMIVISDLLADRAGLVKGCGCCGSRGTTCWCST